MKFLYYRDACILGLQVSMIGLRVLRISRYYGVSWIMGDRSYAVAGIMGFIVLQYKLYYGIVCVMKLEVA